VKNFIYSSIIGIEHFARFFYYKAKFEAERMIESSGVPYTILRAAQLHSLIDGVLKAVNRLPIILLPTTMQVQTVDTGEVAAQLALLAHEAALKRVPEVAGPEVLRSGEMARIWLNLRGIRKPVINLPLRGETIDAFRRGLNTAPRQTIGKITGRNGSPVSTISPRQKQSPRRCHKGDKIMNWKQAYARSIAVAVGVSYLAALALLLSQDWFFNNIGNYPPYNRHYMGDAGSFVSVLGLMLLWAARDPARHWAMILLAGVGSLVHAANHVIEDFITNPSNASVASNVLLFVLAFAMLLAAWAAKTSADSRTVSRPTTAPDRVARQR
jgi:hypothetical protein